LIRDVAEVNFGHAVRYGSVTYNGEKEVVGGMVMMLKGANSDEVIKNVKAKIENIKKILPDDVEIEPFLDRTNLVSRAINTVKRLVKLPVLLVVPTPIGEGATIENEKGARPLAILSKKIAPFAALSQVTSFFLMLKRGSRYEPGTTTRKIESVQLVLISVT